MMRSKVISGLMKKILGFAPKRSIPILYKTTLRKWARKGAGGKGQDTRYASSQHPTPNIQHPASKKVYLFADEFTNYNDAEIGITAVKLLTALDYKVEIPKHKFSGRTFLSKGLVKKAAKLASFNVEAMHNIITAETPLIGIEPSGILTFRDEYPELVGSEKEEKAQALSVCCFTIDEFIASEFEKGNIRSDSFNTRDLNIIVHGHCYQKSLSSVEPTLKMLQIPVNYSVSEIKSGCCGMAGAFGYEKEHYELSMKVGEMVLFPAVRESDKDTVIAAAGTSCRHQIKDGTGRRALHPVEVLYNALKQ
jgi:Fe-S oxidoreductase